MIECPHCDWRTEGALTAALHVHIDQAHPELCRTCAADKAADPVNPAHYHGDYVMRIIENFKLDFLSGTIVKYLLRAGNKPGDSIQQDLLKACWYLDRKIASLEESEGVDREEQDRRRDQGLAASVNAGSETEVRGGDPCEYTLEDYRNAPSGIGPLAATWKDKPHRLLYDLINRETLREWGPRFPGAAPTVEPKPKGTDS